MQKWHDRFKEIREKHRLSQADIGRKMGKDATQISRYERGAVKKFPNSLYKILQSIFSADEISYIEHGQEAKDMIRQSGRHSIGKIGDVGTMHSGDTKGEGSVKDNGSLYKDLPADVQTIVDYLLEMDKDQRKEVMKFVVGL